MRNTDAFSETFKTAYGKVRAVCGKIGDVMGVICKWIYRLRKGILAIPVVYVAISIAVRNRPAASGIRGTEPAAQRRVCHDGYPRLCGVWPASGDWLLPASDVLLQKSPVSLGDQHFFSGAAVPDLFYEPLSRLNSKPPLGGFFCNYLVIDYLDADQGFFTNLHFHML